VPPWSFVGRAAELARLTDAATSATGRGLIFGGTAGIGKSRLLREGIATIDTDRVAVWNATANAATAGLPLGGLSPVLPADQPPGATPAGLLRWAVDALHRQAAGRPIVLAIDDAHLLDPLSATLVYYVARTERATVLGTVRTGETLPDSIRSLWTDDLVERVELGPLTEEETADLLSQVLGGPVDSASVTRLWQLSQGNALLLRELVIGARTSGEVTQAYGVWRWTGRLELAPTLTEVVDARIGELTPDVRAVLELVSFGEPIGLPLLSRATDGPAVELAEERQLIRVVRDDRRVNVRLTHPLYGEVVRQRCPVTRVRRLLADLADLVEQTGARRREDLLRVAVWRLDSDTAHDPRQLLHACGQAFASYDMPLAFRLARAALAAGGGFAAAELVATLLMFFDQPAEALSILDSARDQIGTEEQHRRWLVIRAIVTYWGLADETTPDLLADAAKELSDPRHHSFIRALQSSIRLHHGELAAAADLARSVLDSPASGAGPRAMAASTIGHLQAARGAPVQTMRAMAAVEADAAQWRTESPYIQLAVELSRGTAMILAGDLDAVDEIVAAEFAGMADAGDFRLGSGYLTLLRSQAARLRGRLADAARYASQAAAILAGSQVFAALANAERAHVAALSGDHAGAAEAMSEADRRHRPTMTILYPWLETARCWVAACSGDVPTAVDVMHRLLDRLRADELTGHEVLALHDLVRLGNADEVADRLGELSHVVEGGAAPVMAWHARAAADRDGQSLFAAAEEFVDLGMVLYAAEATAMAVPLLRAARATQTSHAAELLADLVNRLGGAQTPALAVRPPSLTGRERQIAKLAAAGVPSKEIADQLYLSARTVDNHLLRVYAKLGVSGRTELAAALRAIPADEAGP
jgi:ATP/maltotriose-dependent transcriptional regulator MalT